MQRHSGRSGKVLAYGVGAAFLATATIACGPLHPRWKNLSGRDIEVLYFAGETTVRTKLARGSVAIPRAFIDFQKVDRIEVIDAGTTYRLDKSQVSQLHNDCGHGYSCRIEYLAPDHVTAFPN